MLRRFLILAGMTLFLLGAAALNSPSFQECMQTNDGRHSHSQLKDSLPTFIVGAARSVYCLGPFFEHNRDAFAAFSTVLLAVFTGTLWWSTEKLWRVARDQAKDTQESLSIARGAAEAAQKSADASVAAERAWLHIDIVWNNFDMVFALARRFPNSPSMGDSAMENKPSLRFIFTNYGKTPAVIKEYSQSDIVVSETPPLIVYDYPLEPFSQYMIGYHFSTAPREVTMKQSLAYAAAQDIANGTKSLWFSGRLDYEDVFGKRHTHRFYWQGNGKVPMRPYDHEFYNKSN